jgi:hypothetical protein
MSTHALVASDPGVATSEHTPGVSRALAILMLAVAGAAPVAAQTGVGVSVTINQPGVYGRIDIGNLPPPPVVYPQPVVIAPTPVAVYQRPVYLYVPPGHQKNWGKHCSRYAACGQPVYFVQEAWVRDRWDHYEREHPSHGKSGKGKGKHG